MTSPARTFSITWDYRCPFARNAHEHVLTALEAGAAWDVTFVPFSLDQVHVDELEVPAWDRPAEFPGLLVNQAGLVVRDELPDRFAAVHRALFAARHDDARDIRDEAVVRAVLVTHGVDDGAVFDRIASGEALDRLRTEHEAAAREHSVWGVPTFIVGDQAVFVRLMSRPDGDAELAQRTIERVLDAVEFRDLNELKHTSIPR